MPVLALNYKPTHRTACRIGESMTSLNTLQDHEVLSKKIEELKAKCDCDNPALNFKVELEDFLHKNSEFKSVFQYQGNSLRGFCLRLYTSYDIARCKAILNELCDVVKSQIDALCKVKENTEIQIQSAISNLRNYPELSDILPVKLGFNPDIKPSDTNYASSLNRLKLVLPKLHLNTKEQKEKRREVLYLIAKHDVISAEIQYLKDITIEIKKEAWQLDPLLPNYSSPYNLAIDKWLAENEDSPNNVLQGQQSHNDGFQADDIDDVFDEELEQELEQDVLNDLNAEISAQESAIEELGIKMGIEADIIIQGSCSPVSKENARIKLASCKNKLDLYQFELRRLKDERDFMLEQCLIVI
ncbi:MAG: hypothetical protein V4591_01850 [Bdellovibrionota bacterium]